MVFAYLVTGTTGVGKSTVARRLAEVMQAEFVELDWIIAGWRTLAGEPADMRPEDPDGEWLQLHRWCWDLSRLEELLDETPETIVCAGYADNMEAAFSRFERVIVLTVDAATQQARLGDPSRDNTFAMRDEVRQLMASHLEEFQPRMAARSDVATVDARPPLDVVVEEIKLILGTVDSAPSTHPSEP